MFGNPAQKWIGSVSAPSADSRDIRPGCRLAAQPGGSTLMPMAAGPATTVNHRARRAHLHRYRHGRRRRH
jgi:hypothetical protein